MNEEVRRLEALASAQRDLIKELERENRRLKTLTQTQGHRIQDLEETNVLIDRDITEIPIDFDLIPESDLKRH